MSQEVAGDPLGEEFEGYVFKISGGNDKQGFPMKQGVLLNKRTRLLMAEGASCYRPRRKGERKRKSVRGCIVGPDLSVVNLVIVKRGKKDLPGVTDVSRPRRLGPKRASKIRKLFDLTKGDDVRKFAPRRELPAKEGKKPRTKAPKIQRLVTPVVLQRKRARKAFKIQHAQKSKLEAKAYADLLAERIQQRKAERAAAIAKKKAKKQTQA